MSSHGNPLHSGNGGESDSEMAPLRSQAVEERTEDDGANHESHQQNAPKQQRNESPAEGGIVLAIPPPAARVKIVAPGDSPQNGARPVGGQSSAVSGTSAAGSAAPAEASAANATRSLGAAEIANAAMHPIWLTFTEPEMEARYCEFAYVTSGFYGGKLWHGIAFMILLISFFYYHTIKHGFSEAMFTDQYWVALTASAVVTVFMGVCCFIPALFPYREIMFLISLFTHWPSFTISFFYGMGHRFNYTYALLSGCFFFCTFVVQARFSRSVWFISASPLLTLIVSTNTFPAKFWNHHRVEEIVYWAFLFFPVTILYFFERNSRKCFVAMEMHAKQIGSIEDRIEATQALIANFFPQTPTMDILAEGSSLKQCQIYPRTALVVTDLEGFTAWTSTATPQRVISTLSHMFDSMDALLAVYDVEKVSTVGDSFFGASFAKQQKQQQHEEGRSAEFTEALRCVRAIMFSTKILPFGGDMRLRIGVHIGDVTGAFVGAAPPKFDLFGPVVYKAKTYEQGGVAGKVHLSAQIVDAIKSLARPAAPEITSMGGQAINSLEFLDPSVVVEIPKDDGEEAKMSPHITFKVCQALLSLGSRARRVSATTESHLRDNRPNIGVLTALAMEPSLGSAGAFSSAFISSPSFQPDAAVEPVVLGGADDNSMGGVQNSGTAVVVPASLATSPSMLSSGVRDGRLPRRQSDFLQDPADRQKSSSSFRHIGSFLSGVASSPGSQSAPASTVASATVRRRGTVDSVNGAFPESGAANDPTAFHPLFLNFNSIAMERQFVRFLAQTRLMDRTFFVTSIMMIYLHLCEVIVGCFETLQSRLLFGLQLAIVGVLAIVLRGGTNFRGFTVFILAAYFSNAFVSFWLTAGCGSDAEFYIGTICSMNVLQGILVTQFLLRHTLKTRLVLNFVACCMGVVGNVVRLYIVKDDALPWDPMWVVGFLGLAFVSYFADFSLRSAFSMDRRLRALLRRTTSRQHQAARGALDLMLPPFVSARLLGRRNEASSSDDEHGLNVPSSGEAAAGGGGAGSGNAEDGGDLNQSMRADSLLATESSSHEAEIIDTATFRENDKLWQFKGVCVIFIYFNPPHDETASLSSNTMAAEYEIDVASQTIRSMEVILTANGVHKIKTIGQTMMCVHGINDEADTISATLKSVLEVRRKVFESRLDWEFTVGVHFGPCLGAVLGTTSLIFDIFGDTVNLASRMQTNAPPRSIQVTSAVFEDGKQDFIFEKRPPVNVKGKGLLDAYTLTSFA